MIVFKVECDQGGGKKSRGAMFGPMAIEDAFYKIPWRGAEDGSSHPVIQWVHYIASLEKYREKAESIFAKTLVPFISLSGDNSCSFETVRAVAQHTKNIALAVLDAHPDACGFAHDPHAYWVRQLWQEGIVAPEKTIFFGIRDPEEEEARFIKEKNALVIAPEQMDAFLLLGSYTAAQCIVRCMGRWQPLSDHVLVIIVDIDVLDPAFAPGTGILRAGGLNVRQVLNIIRRLCALPFAMKVGEICEVIPEEGNSLRLSDKRPDPCGFTVLAADAIFRQMLQSLQP